MPESVATAPKDITTYLKHYGFFFPNAEIYGGLAKSWDLGPCGPAVICVNQRTAAQYGLTHSKNA